MLVLSRRPGESIMIGHEIVLTVLEVRGDVVRIGIKAPRDVDVHREEIFLELQQANRSAASPSAEGIDTLAATLLTSGVVVVESDSAPADPVSVGRGSVGPAQVSSGSVRPGRVDRRPVGPVPKPGAPPKS